MKFAELGIPRDRASRALQLEAHRRRTRPPAQACRAMAYQEGERARKMENPTMRAPMQHTAKRYAELAQKFEAARKSQASVSTTCR